MPLILSFFSRGPNEDVLKNHAHYSNLYGYTHATFSGSHVPSPVLRASYKYSQILRHLRQLDEGDCLLFLDDDSVILRPMTLEVLMQGRDVLVVDGPSASAYPPRLLMNLIGLRNTESTRKMLHGLIVRCAQVIALIIDWVDERQCVDPSDILERNGVVGGLHVNVHWQMPNWYVANVFAMYLGPVPAVRPWAPHEQMMHDLNMQALLVRRINAAFLAGEEVFPPPAYTALSDDKLSSVNPEAPVALVSLYTHHISTYARISEHNIRRYCERHGYAYHVYRDIPSDLDPAINGTWVKSWLLLRHFAAHEWVIWVDADILFLDQSQRLEPLLQGRERLFAKDIAAWPINAGVMGFKNSEANSRLLHDIWERISAVPDKSTVYSSQGDQYYIATLLKERGLVGEADVVDNTSINTPPPLHTPDSLMVHFISLGEPYRSAYMADLDALSRRLDERGTA